MRTGREVWSQMFSKCQAFLASKSYMSSKIKYDSTSGTVSNSRDTSPSCSVCRSRGMRLGGRQFEAWGMGTYAEIVQLCQCGQPRPVFVHGLAGNDGENIPVDCGCLCWLWLGLWRVCGRGGLLCACRRRCRVGDLCGGRAGALGGWGWQSSGGHG